MSEKRQKRCPAAFLNRECAPSLEWSFCAFVEKK